MTLIDLVAAWGHGWALSRGVPLPTPVPGGWRFDVGLPGHRVRYVLHTPSPQLYRAVPGTWIKLCGPPEDLRAALPDTWTMFDTGYLMTVPFAGGPLPAPDPYRLEVSIVDQVTVATVRTPDGEVAASGRLAPSGTFGMIDKVLTDPTHQRRGLGTVVMRALTAHALQNNRQTGILVATPEGRHLYESLGWTTQTPMAAAFVPENRE